MSYFRVLIFDKCVWISFVFFLEWLIRSLTRFDRWNRIKSVQKPTGCNEMFDQKRQWKRKQKNSSIIFLHNNQRNYEIWCSPAKDESSTRRHFFCEFSFARGPISATSFLLKPPPKKKHHNIQGKKKWKETNRQPSNTHAPKKNRQTTKYWTLFFSARARVCVCVCVCVYVDSGGHWEAADRKRDV